MKKTKLLMGLCLLIMFSLAAIMTACIKFPVIPPLPTPILTANITFKYSEESSVIIKAEINKKIPMDKLPLDPRPYGNKVFRFWSADGSTDFVSVKTVKSDVTLTPVFRDRAAGEYVVWFDSQTDTYIPTQILQWNSHANTVASPVKSKYKFLGWQIEGGGFFDFDSTVILHDYFLTAIWESEKYFVIVPPENADDNFDQEGYDALAFFEISAEGHIKISQVELPQKSGFQIKSFYLDKACTERIVFDEDDKYYPSEIEFDESTGRFKIFRVYIDWLDAKYTIVSKARDIMKIEPDASYYILNDLDFSGVQLYVADEFRGEIIGNNYTWKNLSNTVQEKYPQKGLNNYGGIFKNLVSAKITGITFENLNINFIRFNPYYGDGNSWKNPVVVNVFAKSIDSRSVLKDIKINEGACIWIKKTIEFGDYRLIEYDPVYGFPYRLSAGWDELIPIPAKGVDGYGNPIYPENGDIYPENGDIYNGHRVSYLKDIFDQYSVLKTNAVDSEDGRALLGIYLSEQWDNIIPPQIWQNDANFGKDSANITGCEVNIKIEYNEAYDWMILYQPGTAEPPAPENNMKYLEWAGWYKEIIDDGKIMGYEKFDFENPGTDQPVKLIAMWKRL